MIQNKSGVTCKVYGIVLRLKVPGGVSNRKNQRIFFDQGIIYHEFGEIDQEEMKLPEVLWICVEKDICFRWSNCH